MNRRSLIAVGALLLIGGGGWIVAQEATSKRTPQPAATAAAPPAPVRPQDVQAIKAASSAFAKAFETGDEKGVSALFTEEVRAGFRSLR